MAYRRREIKGELKGIPFNVKSDLARRLLSNLSFELTEAQRRVIKEITGDMSQSVPMNRLLQGDVGSGKTIVALFAMLDRSGERVSMRIYGADGDFGGTAFFYAQEFFREICQSMSAFLSADKRKNCVTIFWKMFAAVRRIL